jgi:ABC-type glycerol-3-phosphate transport system substrate-binding protein
MHEGMNEGGAVRQKSFCSKFVILLNKEQEMFKRLSLIGLSAAAMALTLSISPIIAQSATDTPLPPTPTPIVSTDLGTGGTHIALWDGLTGSDGSTFDSMLGQFVKENPDISITDEEIDWNTFYAKLQAAFVANQPPDMFVFHVAEIPVFASQGLLMPTDNLFDTGGGTLPSKDYADPAWSQTQYNGQRYGVLLDNHGYSTWINTDMFKAAGLDPTKEPTSYADIVTMLQKLTLDKNGKNAADPAFDANNVVQWGWEPDWLHYAFQSVMFQYGGSVISADGKTAVINSPQNVQALQSMLDMVFKYHVAPPPAGFDSWGAFAAGKLAVINSGTWFLNEAKSTGRNFAAWPVLQFGPNPGVMFGAHTMQIPAGLSGDKLTAVQKIVTWMSNHDDLWAASGQVPARISFRDGLDPSKYISNVTIGKTFSQYGHMEAQSPAELDIVNAEDPDLSAAFANQMTAQAALDDANQRIQQILDRQNAS